MAITVDQAILLQKIFEREPERIRNVVDYLAASGWYYSLNSSWRYFIIAEKCFKNGDISRVDSEYSAYFEESMENCGRKIVETFPTRERIIMDSITAHTKASFSLSTLGFLSQCDGIFQELTGSEQLFSSRMDARKKIADILKEKYTHDGEYKNTEAFLSPLEKVYPHYQSGQQKDKAYNRNGIMHGEIVDYWRTPLNSLKAFSYLVFISEIKLVLDESI